MKFSSYSPATDAWLSIWGVWNAIHFFYFDTLEKNLCYCYFSLKKTTKKKTYDTHKDYSSLCKFFKVKINKYTVSKTHQKYSGIQKV